MYLAEFGAVVFQNALVFPVAAVCIALGESIGQIMKFGGFLSRNYTNADLKMLPKLEKFGLVKSYLKTAIPPGTSIFFIALFKSGIVPNQ